MRSLSLLAVLCLGSVLAWPLGSLAQDAGAKHEEPGHATGHEGGAEAGASADHGGGAAHGGDPNILEAQIPLAVWSFLVFVLLLVILGKYAWGPMMKALHDREHAMEKAHADAERARAEAAELLAQHQRQMQEATAQVRSLLDEARRNGQATAEEIVKKAQGEAEMARQRAERDIQTAKDQALSELWTTSANLAVSVAGKVLSKEMTEDDRRRLVDRAVQQLPSGPNGRGA
jgi:F-type H+-transporting ATPase subunit b